MQPVCSSEYQSLDFSFSFLSFSPDILIILVQNEEI